MIGRFLLRKCSFLLLTLFFVITFTFFLMKIAPGDPFMEECPVPEEITKQLLKQYGLDKPWYVQYLLYLKRIATWNLGASLKYEAQSVNLIIAEGFPISCILGIQSLLFSLGIGITLGAISSIKAGRWQDRLSMFLATLGISLPNFILATFLQFIFAIKLSLLPIGRWGTFSHTLLPTLALGAFPTAFIARLVRANMIDILQKDYILTAQSKGLTLFQILSRHALKNSLLPVIAYLGPLTASIVTGSFVIERIFGIPGMGDWLITSVTNRDYTLILGITVFYSFLLIVATLITDIVYTLLDPRIPCEFRKG